MEGTLRKNIRIGTQVEVVQKHHQRSGELTRGMVKKILTNSPSHPHGIKVMLEDGIVGRVKSILVKIPFTSLFLFKKIPLGFLFFR